MKNKLTFALENEGFVLNSDQIDKFLLFASLIKDWNTKINLTALEKDEDIVYKHFVDSLLCLKTNIDWNEKKVIDVGTGAGFPGIPLKIMLGDDLKLILFDSLQKRVKFLEFVVNELGLKEVKCIHGRAEEYGKIKEHREQYDIVLARAVARLPLLLELCLPFSKVGGFFLTMKGPEGSMELEESSYALEQLGGTFKDINHFTLKEHEIKRTIISIEKTKAIPEKYPRKAGIPQKRPLLKN